MRKPDHIIVEDVLEPWQCDSLIDLFHSSPRVEYVLQPDGKGTSPVEEMHRSWRSLHEDKEICWLPSDSEQYDFVCSIVSEFLPEREEYRQVRHIQIIKYPENGVFHWHKDAADINDRATALITLNQDFIGGNLCVEDLTFVGKQGRMVAFNNSTERWHTVSPILNGTRYVLALWLGDGTTVPR